MKEVKTVDAVGHILCHDITEIVKDVTKGARFRKGHIVTEEDIPILLNLGKEHLYIWEKKETEYHEDEAAAVLERLTKGEGLSAVGAPVEGKIELVADYPGVLLIDEDRVDNINDLNDMCIATLPQYYPVHKGEKVAGMRVIPLVIEKAKMAAAEELAGSKPLLRVAPYKPIKVGIITTGSEVYTKRIKDTFTPVIEAKFQHYGITPQEKRISNDDPAMTTAFIAELAELGMDIIICTGGMSVDPDDKTPLAIKNSGARIVTYGAPVLPGAMFLVSYLEHKGRTIAVLGLPGCVMYASTTIFDIALPRLIAGIEITKKSIRHLGVGGLCKNCPTCHYPLCSFGK